MTLTLDFQGQILKQPYLMNRRANWQWIIGVIHDHDRDLFVTKMRCKELPDSDQGDFRCWRAIDSSCWYPWLEDLFAFGLPYQINSQLLVIWLLLSTKLCFHFTVWVVRSRPHLNVFNFFLLHTATYVSYITEYEPCTWHHVSQLVFYLNLHTYIWKQATHSAMVWFHGQYPT